MKEQGNSLLDKIKDLSEQEALQFLAKEYEGSIVFSSSFGMEDQVISHLILSQEIPIEIFTLDTGRMFNETYSTWQRTQDVYQTSITPYYPERESVEKYVKENGINAFYESPELRKLCCHVRKVEPLNRALKGQKIWVTGLRAEQSPARKDLQQLEWDEAHQLFKFHPLLHWTTQQVKTFINKNYIPYNPLHDKGFISIGCAPCTRAVKEGEDFRAGRWWWEDQSKKECGLHIKN